MFEAYYHLKEQPFRLSPDPTFICMTANHQEALAGLVYSTCTRPGLTVLTGEAGTGKTTLLYALLDLLEKRQYVSVLCTNPVLSREELFDFLTVKFGTNCTSPMKSRQLMALQEKLLQLKAEGRTALLIVDEAHRLSMELLEEIRLLLNLETTREKLLQIIIVGQPELVEILHRPELRQFKQRVSCQCKLQPLKLAELKEYIDHRLKQAGLPDQKLFPDPVVGRIYQYTEGIPRLINSLCDGALQNGFAVQAQVITHAIVDEVAEDLDMKLHGSPEMPQPLLAPKPAPVADPPVLPVVPALPPVPVVKAQNGHAATAVLETNHNGQGHDGGEYPEEARVPLQNYSARQKSIGLFASLIERWK